MALPFPKKHIVCLQFTHHKWYTSLAKNSDDSCKAGYNMWSERIEQTFKVPYGKEERIGKVFLILMNEEKETLCYHQFNALEFLREKPEWKYYEMTPDPSVGKVKEGKSGGIISFRCYLRKVAEFNDPINNMMLVKKLPKRPKAQKVRAYIF